MADSRSKSDDDLVDDLAEEKQAADPAEPITGDAPAPLEPVEEEDGSPEP
jgi:hypothetical protein